LKKGDFVALAILAAALIAGGLVTAQPPKKERTSPPGASASSALRTDEFASWNPTVPIRCAFIPGG
jgi:hypothetical protein